MHPVEPRHEQWKGTTGGTPWMQKALVFFLGWMNLPFVYSGMAVVIVFYMIFNHQGYITQYHFFRRRMGYGPLRAFWNVYLNHFRFGQIILDRFAVYGGVKFEMEIEGYDIYRQLQQGAEGFVQLSSHIGNFELAGYMLSPEPKHIYALVFGGETETMMQNRRRVLGQQNIHLIPVDGEMGHVYTLNNALEEGHIVSMPGDRIFGSQKSVRCRFMGAEASFPMGPYILAATRGAALLSIFVMKKSVHKYQIYVQRVEVPEEARCLNTRKRAEALAQTFATQLEDVVRRYPNQWFNYYEFWQ